MFNSYFTTWKKAFKFQGRSTRKEYWFFVLINFFVTLLLIFFNLIQSLLRTYYFSSGNDFLQILSNFITILNFIPAIILLGSIWVVLPLTIRRIRDVGMKWQWIFLASIPYIGTIFILIFLTRTSVIDMDDKQYFIKY
tara:strand:- start:671 stop:1084 length:414 start_codon:yes stop_codon:yes gene_type:complete